MNINNKPFMTSIEAADYMDISINTLYSYCSRRLLSYYKLNGRKMYFRKNELDNYICNSANFYKKDRTIEERKENE